MINKKEINTLILSAGKFNPKNISAGMITETGLLPIRGKPAINWIIDSVRKNGCDNIKIVLRKNNTRLSKVLSYSHPDVEQIFVGDSEDLSISLVKILNTCDDKYPTQVILGDTLINEDFPQEDDVFLSSKNIKTSKQWCLVTKDENNHILRVYNKEKDISLAGKEALVGYYKFSNTKLLKDIAINELTNGDKNFIKILATYNSQVPVIIKRTENWLDFGHISGAVQARLALFNAREFNNLKVDAVRGTITKTSRKKQKLLDEAKWYQSLPNELLCYAPRVFSIEENEKFASVEMELYGYANLAETFIYGSNNLEDWYNIIESLLKVHKVFEKYTETVDREEYEEIYINKTHQRLEETKNKSPEISKMMTDEYITINNIHYKNYPLIEEDLNKAIAKLVAFNKRTVVHGDYCFSNILFDPMHYIFKLVDPRGRFKEQTIYGDPRYDIAKLRHSIVGLYDFIVAGLYRLTELNSGNYEFQVSTPILADKLEVFFDELVVEYGYDSKEIKLIEALLFLTMIPLHSDDIKRQKAFYLTAIRKLNEVLYGE